MSTRYSVVRYFRLGQSVSANCTARRAREMLAECYRQETRADVVCGTTGAVVAEVLQDKRGRWTVGGFIP